MKKTDLKVVELKIDELDLETGVNAMALTDDPAIEIMGVMMKKEEERFLSITKVESKHQKLVFSEDENEQHIITGPCMIPNLQIYRIDEKTGEEYYAYFSEETVKACSQNFIKVGGQYNINWNHESQLPGNFITESWLVEDPENDKSNALGFSNLPKGTWMISVKVTDIDVWKRLKKTKCGFSIEGMFAFQKSKAVAEAQAAVEANQKLTEEEMIEGVKNIFDSKETEDEKLAILQQIMRDLE